MNYGEIKNCDIADGPGIRVSLFVSGCRNHCKGCFNKETWNFSYGKLYTEEIAKKLMEALRPPYITGLTILGGDPFEPENLPEVTQLCRLFSIQYPRKTLWVYTGYLYENIKNNEIMNYIDVLVDGPFVEELKDLSLRFKGSSNQRLIDVHKSLEYDKVTPWRDEAYEAQMKPSKPGGAITRGGNC